MMCLSHTTSTLKHVSIRELSLTPHSEQETIKHRTMETNYSTLWITLLNSVVASIAFMVWYLTNIEEEKPAKIDNNIRIVKTDEEEEAVDTTEEKHLYIKPNLRNQDNILRYNEYCDSSKTVKKEAPQQQQELYKELYQPAEPQKPVKKQQKTEESSGTFQWPRQDDVIESLRSMNKNNLSISTSLAQKLSDNGIMRSAENDDTDIKISEAARISGRKITKKQVCVVWDVFQATSRPGLEHSSPEASPRVKKPLMKKHQKTPQQLKSKKFEQSVQPLNYAAAVRAA